MINSNTGTRKHTPYFTIFVIVIVLLLKYTIYSRLNFLFRFSFSIHGIPRWIIKLNTISITEEKPSSVKAAPIIASCHVDAASPPKNGMAISVANPIKKNKISFAL